MNAPVVIPPGKPPASRRSRADQEFLPAALAILETPPSPVTIALMLTICLLAATALGWAYWGHVDIVAIAQGKIQPSGRVKVIEPLVTGKVAAIAVENGTHVRAGDVLIALASAEAVADGRGLATALAATEGEAARRRAAILAVERMGRAGAGFVETPSPDYPGRVPADIRQREDRVLAADLARLASDLASLVAQSHQKQAERARLATTVVAQRALLATLRERVTMRDALVTLQAGARANVIDALEKAQTQEAVLAMQQGQLAETAAALEVLEEERTKTRDGFLADNQQKLAEASRQTDDLTERLAKAEAVTAHMTLSSPIDGTVQALAVTTVGQVVTTGEEIMRIVPDGVTLEVEAYLPNKDIGFVAVGQEAAIKIESFPFTRYGTVTGRVTRVAKDAIPEPDLRAAQNGTAGGPRQSGLDVAGQRVQNLVFPILVHPTRSSISVDGVAVPLSPGMAVSVEIKTGRRRILEYLFSPLVEVTSQSMRER